MNKEKLSKIKDDALIDLALDLKLNKSQPYYAACWILDVSEFNQDILQPVVDKLIKIKEKSEYSYSCYGINSIEIFQEIIKRNLQFEFHNKNKARIPNVDGVNKLINLNLGECISDFCTDFRGDVLKVHRMDGHCYIQTSKAFHISEDASNSFDTLNDAIIYNLFGPQHFKSVHLIFKNK